MGAKAPQIKPKVTELALGQQCGYTNRETVQTDAKQPQESEAKLISQLATVSISEHENIKSKETLKPRPTIS